MLTKKYTIHADYGSSLIDHSPEDSALVSDRYPIIAAADGVTILDRNPDGTYPVFPDGRSGPKKVSDIFCQTAVSRLEKQYPEIDPETVKKAFEKGNEKVRQTNQKLLKIKPGDDNYGPDAFSTVAAVACLVKNRLIYGFLTDCGIALVKENARLKFITPEIWPRLQKPTDRHLKKIIKKGKPGYRQFRTFVRNNPELAVKGKFYSHGVINGQTGMIAYVEVGQQKFNQGDTVVVFTDGFRHYFQHREFLKIISGDINELEKKLDFLGFEFLAKRKKSMPEYSLERTLVLLRI